VNDEIVSFVGSQMKSSGMNIQGFLPAMAGPSASRAPPDRPLVARACLLTAAEEQAEN